MEYGPILGIYIYRSQIHDVELVTEAMRFLEKEYINGIFLAV
jgi:hypothetical protein